MATSNLNFKIVENNNVTLQVTVLDQNGNGVNGSGYVIKWKWFLPNNTISKSTTSGNIQIVTANPLVFNVIISDTDTLGSIEGNYPHEFIAIDSASNPVTITNNDARITHGTGFLRKQLVTP